MFRMLLIATLMTASLAHAAGSGDVRLYQENDRVDPREVARILGGQTAQPAPAADEPIRTRSIRMLQEPAARPDAAARRAPATGGASAAGTASALALPIQFEFDSADIRPEARGQLDALAEGVRLLEPSRKVTIEGHTDAKGTDQYNLDLSRRRAQAVKRYLVESAGIDPARLNAVGLGKQQPYDRNDPFAAENRRVQFRGN